MKQSLGSLKKMNNIDNLLANITDRMIDNNKIKKIRDWKIVFKTDSNETRHLYTLKAYNKLGNLPGLNAMHF